MPIYEYECKKCGLVKEELRDSHNEPDMLTCPRCNDVMKKIISNVNIVFIGTGWTGKSERK